jgi:tetratricopeptide (TPR) repeat protein
MSVQGPGRAGAIADALKAGLSDPARTVRIAAALGLVNLGPSHLPLGDPAFTRAVAETRQQFEISADDADRQLEAGWFYLKSGDPARALNAVKITSRLDPQLPVRYLEGGALAMLGRMEEARRALQQVPRSDRWYREAQQMLGALAGR